MTPAAFRAVSLQAIIERTDRTCVDVDPEVFFPPTETPSAVEYAKRFCRRCPIVTACLIYALAHDGQVIVGQRQRSLERHAPLQHMGSASVTSVVSLRAFIHFRA